MSRSLANTRELIAVSRSGRSLPKSLPILAPNPRIHRRRDRVETVHYRLVTHGVVLLSGAIGTLCAPAADRGKFAILGGAVVLGIFGFSPVLVRPVDALISAFKSFAELSHVLIRRSNRQWDVRSHLIVEQWDEKLTAQLLSWAASVLPSDLQETFVEEQCANMAATQSRLESLAYFVGLVTHLPFIALTFHSEQRRARTQ